MDSELLIEARPEAANSGRDYLGEWIGDLPPALPAPYLGGKALLCQVGRHGDVEPFVWDRRNYIAEWIGWENYHAD